MKKKGGNMPKKIFIIVEDNPLLRSFFMDSIRRIIWKTNKRIYYEVRSIDVVDEIKLSPKGFILIGMDFNGESMLGIIKSLKKDGYPVVIATSGLPANKELAIKAGADFFVNQPDDLPRKIENIITTLL